jgi:dihydrofolate reductase
MKIPFKMKNWVGTGVAALAAGVLLIGSAFGASAGQHDLNAEEAKAKSEGFLFDDLKTRLAAGLIEYHLIVQLPNAGEPTKDPSILWPEDHKTIDMGTISITSVVADSSPAKKFPRDPAYAFARSITETEKVVFSKRLKKSKWDGAILSRDLTGKIRALKRQPGKNIIAFGGVNFASALLEKGLVDEFQFFVNPTVLGRGLSIFKRLNKPLALDLNESNSYDCGIVSERNLVGRIRA